jgi:hypothetical protein
MPKKIEYLCKTSFFEYGKGKHRTSGEVTEEDLKYRGQYSIQETFTIMSELIEQLDVPLNTQIKITIEEIKPE